MEKLSDNIKNYMQIQEGKNSLTVYEVLKSYLPEIEKIENEKDLLIKKIDLLANNACKDAQYDDGCAPDESYCNKCQIFSCLDLLKQMVDPDYKICANCIYYKLIFGHLFCCKDKGDKDGSKKSYNKCDCFKCSPNIVHKDPSKC